MCASGGCISFRLIQQLLVAIMCLEATEDVTPAVRMMTIMIVLSTSICVHSFIGILSTCVFLEPLYPSCAALLQLPCTLLCEVYRL